MENDKIPIANSQFSVYALGPKDVLSPSSRAPRKRAPISLRLFILLIGFCLSYGAYEWLWDVSPSSRVRVFSTASSDSDSRVYWKSCGEGTEGYECANITVPLDYHNASDTRTITIAVTRFPAADKVNRCVFFFVL
jgi:hypothetical protein